MRIYKSKLKVFLLFVVIIALVPTILGLLLMSISRFWDFEGSPGEWLGYWGGIIGSAVGIIGAVLISQSELQKQRENEAQFLISSLYVSKMEEVQKILVDSYCVFEELHEDIDSFRIDYEVEFSINENRSNRTKKILKKMIVHKNKLVSLRIYYSYFSGKDSFFIEVISHFSKIINKFGALSLIEEYDYLELEILLEEYSNLFEKAQDMVTQEITLSLIKIQSNYSNPENFVNDYDNYKEIIRK